MSDLKLPPNKLVLTPQEAQELKIIRDPVAWCEANLRNPDDPTKPFIIGDRQYQKDMISCQPKKIIQDNGKIIYKDRVKLYRVPRQMGKSIILACELLWRLNTNLNYRILMACPYEDQVRELFDIMLRLTNGADWFNPVQWVQKPFLIRMSNGSTVKGYTAGAKSSQKGASMRGKSGHFILIDEMDRSIDGFMREVVLPIFNARPEVGMIWASTPSGERALFYEWCVPPDTLIKMSDGTYKEIIEVETGDHIITKSGEPKGVIERYSRDFTGTITEITPFDLPTIKLTSEHTMFVYDGKGVVEKESRDITENDELLVPKANVKINDDYVNMSVYPYKHEWEKRSVRSFFSNLNNSLTSGGVIYTLLGDMIALAKFEGERVIVGKDISTELEFLFKIKLKKDGDDFVVNNKLFSITFQKMIRGSIHHAIMNKPTEFKAKLLDSLLNHGVESQNGKALFFSTRIIAYQMMDMALECGYKVSLSDFGPENKQLYRLYISPGTVETIDNYYRFKISDISTSPFVGAVYNLEVEDDHSYTANMVAVHNCTNPKSYDAVQFHYDRWDNPNWSEDSERRARNACQSDNEFAHEYMAEWGSVEEGIFKEKDINDTLGDYEYESWKDKDGVDHIGSIDQYNPMESIYIAGVDWNEVYGVSIIIIEKNRKTKKQRVFMKCVVQKTEFTNTEAVKKIVDINNLYHISWWYVDKGHGDTNIELLKKHGIKHPETRLDSITVAIDFGSNVEIRDPITGALIKKPTKHFLVNNLVHEVENHNLKVGLSEDTRKGLIGQMREYRVKKFSPSGTPTFTGGNDHDLMALGLALLGCVMETTDINEYSTSTAMDSMELFDVGSYGRSSEPGAANTKTALTDIIHKALPDFQHRKAKEGFSDGPVEKGPPTPFRRNISSSSLGRSAPKRRGF